MSEPAQALKRETVVWGFALATLETWELDELEEAEGKADGESVIEG